MRYIKNPLNDVEVENILKYLVPCCKHVREFAWYQNDHFKRVVEVPEWKDKINEDVFLELYNKEEPLDANNSKNLFKADEEELGLEPWFNGIKKVLGKKYQPITLRGSFYYPPTGYMGWHTNCGTPGERFYITWASEDKKSFFRYYDNEKNEIVTDYDDKGITIRQFTIPKSAPYFWHCVGSECDRFSFGFMVGSDVTLDFDMYQKILDGLGDGNITEYINKLVYEKHS